MLTYAANCDFITRFFTYFEKIIQYILIYNGRLHDKIFENLNYSSHLSSKKSQDLDLILFEKRGVCT